MAATWKIVELERNSKAPNKDGILTEIDFNDLPVNKNHLYILENLTSGMPLDFLWKLH